MADELKQILYPASGRQQELILAGGVVTLVRAGTPAEMHDGIEASADVWAHETDGGQGPFADIFVHFTMDPVTYVGAISFLRFCWWMKIQVNQDGNPTPFDPSMITVKPSQRLGAAREWYGNPIAISRDAFGAINADVPVDILSLAAWTSAGIDASKLGVFISDDMNQPDSAFLSETHMAEFRVEVWGPAAEETVERTAIRSKVVVGGRRSALTIGSKRTKIVVP